MPRYYEDKPEGGACAGVKEDLGACLLQSACVLQVANLGGRAQPRLAPCWPAREVMSRVEVARPLLSLDRSLELSSPVLTGVKWEITYYPPKDFVNIQLSQFKKRFPSAGTHFWALSSRDSPAPAPALHSYLICGGDFWFLGFWSMEISYGIP